ncbi:aldose 1-epimerase family protein [Providencia sp. PROV212]|uniref:aldose 1-epimerase family protein n=1 Tax=Providencia sp. PROV212 TaxID=2949909 RepID=UPI00234AB90D|nr:aldose 1-epimerase family protein [Providencia sp. PROV212]
MNTIIPLHKRLFTEKPTLVLKNSQFSVSAFVYQSGVQGLRVENSQGHLTILPFLGQMIWDAEFCGQNLKMENMFSEPKPVPTVIETYGCFAFHSGLISNGCPSPEDNHPLHGEMPCAPMDRAWLELTANSLKVCGEYEYVMGFGHRYRAAPSVQLNADSALFDIHMSVTNLASVPMPLQYMCHMNYAYVDDATLTQNIPEQAIKLRESIPRHVHPTQKWLDFNQALKSGEVTLNQLNQPQMCDPEIVFFMDNLSQYTANPEFKMTSPAGNTFVTRFKANELNYATRWILYNGDQKVGAFVLPATCRPEGFIAAKNNQTLIWLEAGENRQFTVTTGVEQ